MRLVILHYHLNRGGVTRVIANHLLSLDAVLSDPTPVTLFYGGRKEGWPDDLAQQLKWVELTFQTVEGLDYDDADPNVDRLSANLQRALNQIGAKADETILQAHNHNLGKNSSLPGALCRLADDGWALLLQIHDFAEDFRPANYLRLRQSLGKALSDSLYPQLPRVHYAVLNRRDQEVLSSAGVSSDRLHFLPNPVPELHSLPDRIATRRRFQNRFGIDEDRPLALYPIRGIRRKNLGELLLWSTLVREPTHFAVTLPPINPQETGRYQAWKKFAGDHRLPVQFETGARGAFTFEENLSAADVLVSTSVAEGFGMVFLESWLADRSLAGRNLPSVTPDFIESGLRLDHLYNRVDVPVEVVGRDEFAQSLRTACNHLLSAYDRPPLNDHEFEAILEAKIRNESVDFGDLDESLQTHVMEAVLADSSTLESIRERNPTMAQIERDSAERILANRRRVLESFSVKPSGRRIQRIYEAVLESGSDSTPLPPVSASAVLDQFLDLTKFRLIRG